MNRRKTWLSLILAMVATFSHVGCPDLGDRFGDHFTDADIRFDFIRGSYGFDSQIEAGTWGLRWVIYTNVDGPRKYYFSGLGENFWMKGGKENVSLEPMEYSKIYEGPWGSLLQNNSIYRPPLSNDDVPENGTTITFACEVQSPTSGRWVRSKDFKFLLVRRRWPMSFALRYDTPYYLPNNPEPIVADIPAGATARFFVLMDPWPSVDPEPKCGLTSPSGYPGKLGELKTYPDDLSELHLHYGLLREFSLDYTAPEDVSSPMEIVAWLSIHDPWEKKRRKVEITFRVSPK
jgi:hypothetical protein